MYAALFLLGILGLVIILIGTTVMVGTRLEHKRGPVALITILFVCGSILTGMISKRIDALNPEVLRTNEALLLFEQLPPGSISPELAARRDYARNTLTAFSCAIGLIVVMTLASYLPKTRPEFET